MLSKTQFREIQSTPLPHLDPLAISRAKRLMRENEARLREEREDLRRALEAKESAKVLFPVRGSVLRRRSKASSLGSSGKISWRRSRASSGGGGGGQQQPALLDAVMEALPKESLAFK